MEDLDTEREQRLATQQQAEHSEEERRRLDQEYQQLKEELERQRRGHQEILRRAEELERELQGSQVELDRQDRAPAPNRPDKSVASRPWWRRPLLVVGLLLGVLIAWFTSLTVALNMLTS
jgi:ferric-dicitrate binding protein FerR (iron transport regulator)